MKKTLQALLLILVAAMALLAAASSYPASQRKPVNPTGKKQLIDSSAYFNCQHTPDPFMFE